MLVTLFRFTSFFLRESANRAASFFSAFLCALRSARARSPASFLDCLIRAFAPVESSSSSSSLSDSDSDELSSDDPESCCGFCDWLLVFASYCYAGSSTYWLLFVEVAEIHPPGRIRCDRCILLFLLRIAVLCSSTRVQRAVACGNDPQGRLLCRFRRLLHTKVPLGLAFCSSFALRGLHALLLFWCMNPWLL